MRVKSIVTSFFAPPLVRPMVATVMLAIFFIASSFANPADPELRAKQVNLIIRQIGHRLLTQAGDFTSRVLPVTEVRSGTFQLMLERELIFSHDSLIALSQRLLPKSQFPSGYTVTVHDCITHDIIYGFQLSNTSPDNLACQGRNEPPGCYLIEFAFPDFIEKAELKETNKQPMAKVQPLKVAPVVRKKIEESKTTEADEKIDLLTKEIKAVNVDIQRTDIQPEESKTTLFGYPLGNLVYSGMLVLLGLTFVIARYGKTLRPAPAQNQKPAEGKSAALETPTLGKFLFDSEGKRLLLGSEAILLTEKEYQILHLLNAGFGELVPRETLMQEVWINEGVITGRSLDMFVSKLRKKLSRDPDLRITNVHGKGYRLEKTEMGSGVEN